MAEILSEHTGQPLDQVEKDIDRDRFMMPEEAKAYGIIDEVITSRSAAERAGGVLTKGEPGRLIAAAQEEPAPAPKKEE